MSNDEQAKNGALIAYICYGIGVILPFLALVGAIVNFVKKDGATGTWAASHHRWMLRTFLFTVLWTVLGLVLLVIPGINLAVPFALMIVGFWYIYRIIRGFLAFSSSKPMYGSQIIAEVASSEAGA